MNNDEKKRVKTGWCPNRQSVEKAAKTTGKDVSQWAREILLAKADETLRKGALLNP
jgi:hypothetical protein